MAKSRKQAASDSALGITRTPDGKVDPRASRHTARVVATQLSPGVRVRAALLVDGVEVAGTDEWVATAAPGCVAQARVRLHVTDGAAAPHTAHEAPPPRERR